jgi:hypothetical protein
LGAKKSRGHMPTGLEAGIPILGSASTGCGKSSRARGSGVPPSRDRHNSDDFSARWRHEPAATPFFRSLSSPMYARSPARGKPHLARSARQAPVVACLGYSCPLPAPCARNCCLAGDLLRHLTASAPSFHDCSLGPSAPAFPPPVSAPPCAAPSPRKAAVSGDPPPANVKAAGTCLRFVESPMSGVRRTPSESRLRTDGSI